MRDILERVYVAAMLAAWFLAALAWAKGWSL